MNIRILTILLLLGGMAWWYRYYADDQSAEDRGRFESAEKEALARGWGPWAEPDPVPPWVWRRRKLFFASVI